MSISKLKEAFLIPLQNNLQRIKQIPIGNFTASSDLDKQMGVIIGIQDCINHFKNVYDGVANENPALHEEKVTVVEDAEILPPQ